MSNFYTKNGWEGHNFNARLSTKDIAKLLRDYIKSEKDLAECKWSITTDYNTIDVALMSAPFNPFGEGCGENDRQRGYVSNADCEEVSSPKAYAVISKVEAFLVSYNRDDSDGQIDYFNRRFYDWYRIGRWDKPFVQTETKAGKKVEKVVGEFSIVDYSEKAIVVLGDTKSIKDTLKELGGRFNPKLSCGAGWVFSKRSEDKVKSVLGIQ